MMDVNKNSTRLERGSTVSRSNGILEKELMNRVLDEVRINNAFWLDKSGPSTTELLSTTLGKIQQNISQMNEENKP